MSGKHEADRPKHARICTDGTPFLWYFDVDTQIGFAWSGKTNEGIEVNHGGIDEPTINVITKTPHGDTLVEFFRKKNDSRTVVNAFWGLCEMWLTHITRAKEAEEPQAVVEVLASVR